MRYIIYNNYKNKDWLAYKGGLPVGTIIIISNEEFSQEVIDHLDDLGLTAVYSAKLCYGDSSIWALDAENYHNDIKYTHELGHNNPTSILFPENLGGDKYANYDDFIDGVLPDIVCMERTYNVWRPFQLLKFWLRNKYLRDMGIETYMGIWPDSFTGIAVLCRPIQWFFAWLISGGNIFFYSEEKNLP